MTTFHEYLRSEGRPPLWPYPIRYGEEREIETDVLVLGGGIAGCWAAISAARKGVRVALVEKSATIRSGAGGPGCDHWCDAPANPLSKVDPDAWAERLTDAFGGYGCGIGRQIQCRESYDALLELEKMGGKIRDEEGRFKGAEGRDGERQRPFPCRRRTRCCRETRFRGKSPERMRPSAEAPESIGKSCMPESRARCSTSAASTRRNRS